MGIIEDSQGLTDDIIWLRGLLDHKVNRTYPPDLPTTRGLDGAIELIVWSIKNHEDFTTLGDDEFKAAYSRLEEIVNLLDYNVDFSMKERNRLVLVMTELFMAEDFRGRWGPDWDPPKLEIGRYQEGAQESGRKFSKVLSLGKMKAFLKHGN